MSSEESDYDEDYVPSEKSSSPPSSGDEADADDNAQETSAFSKKRRGIGKKDEIDQQKGNKEDKCEKTEDELWNEFLGVDGGKAATAKCEEPKIVPSKNEQNASIPKEPSAVSLSNTTAEISPHSDTGVESKEPIEDFSGVETAENSGNDVKETLPETSNSKIRPPFQTSTLKSGASKLLEKLGKGKKATTLEKSRQDWEAYKSEEGITEDLSVHNRGKGGYLERQEFLDRTDYRQFERERDLRQSRKRKSMLD